MACTKCGSSGRFQPTTATQARWAELKSLLREANTISHPEVPQLLRGVNDDLRRCEAELRKQKAYIISLENQKKMLEQHVSGYQSLLSPIRTIPPEILRAIVSNACVGVESNVDDLRISIPALTLAGVCTRWRDIAFSTPECWSAISLSAVDIMDPSHPKLGKARAVQQLLQQSGDHLISLTLEEDHFSRLPMIQSEFLEVSAQSHRWRSLTVSLDQGPEATSPSLELLQEHIPGLPLLEYISLSLDLDNLDPARPFTPFENAPKLTNVVLHGETRPDFLKLPWGQIQNLQLIHPREPLGCLAACSTLKVVEIALDRQHLETEMQHEPSHHLAHDTIQSLSITLQHPLHPKLFGFFTFPKLASLTLIAEMPPAALPLSFFTDFILRSQCKITTLSLTDFYISLPQAEAICSALSSLRSLSLCVTKLKPKKNGIHKRAVEEEELEGSIVGVLNLLEHFTSPGHYPVFPKLEDLTLRIHHSEMPVDPVVQILQSRWIPDNHCDDLVCLKSVRLDFPKLTLQTSAVESMEQLAEAGLKIMVTDSTGTVVDSDQTCPGFSQLLA